MIEKTSAIYHSSSVKPSGEIRHSVRTGGFRFCRLPGAVFFMAVLLWALPLTAFCQSQSAPDFTLASLEGPSLGLNDFKGKYVLINFWATWCGPCKVEMPSLEALHRKFKNRNFTVLGISTDMFGSTVVEPYVKAHGLTFPMLLDPQLNVSNSFEVMGMPTTVLVDPKGSIIGVKNGAEDWSTPETLKYFEDLLKHQ